MPTGPRALHLISPRSDLNILFFRYSPNNQETFSGQQEFELLAANTGETLDERSLVPHGLVAQPRMRGGLRMRLPKAVIPACLVIGALIPFPAHAVDPLYTITGTVTDVVGRPQSGISMYLNGNQRTSTDESGRYAITCNCIGLGSRWEVQASGYRFATNWKYVYLYGPGEYILDFHDMKYRISGAAVVPENLISLPATLNLQVATMAPREGLCVQAMDSRTGSIHPLQLDSYAGDYSTWKGSFDVPADASPGTFRVEFAGVDCDTRTKLTVSYGSGGGSSGDYVIDLFDPSVSIDTPAQGHAYIASADIGPSSDGQTRLLVGGAVLVTVSARDDTGLERATIRLVDEAGMGSEDSTYLSGTYDRETWLFYLLMPGKYRIEVTVTDRFGGSETAFREFIASESV